MLYYIPMLSDLQKRRKAAIEYALSYNWSYVDIARRLKLTKPRVHQLVVSLGIVPEKVMEGRKAVADRKVEIKFRKLGL